MPKGIYKRKPLTEKHKRKTSKTRKRLFKEGKIKVWNKGKKGVYSKNTLKKMSESRKGIKHTKEAKEKMSIARKGKPKSEEWRNKISKAHIGKKQSKETRDKIAKTRKSRTYDYTNSNKVNAKRFRDLWANPEWRKKMIAKLKGENNRFWRGGVNDPKYPPEFTWKLRNDIRKRDAFRCQLCLKKEGIRKLSVHHIDYNKNNCDKNNLISLCDKCHNKTGDNRDYWQGYFNMYRNMMISFGF